MWPNSEEVPAPVTPAPVTQTKQQIDVPEVPKEIKEKH